MDPNAASEQIQIIRTLMERAALYRRAMAPLMTAAGIVGLLGGGAGWAAHIAPGWGFVGFWSGVAFVALISSLLLVRRQALKDSEPFWSPPTRRVAQAMLPALAAGAFSGPICLAFRPETLPVETMPAIWMLLYGCALCAAGFFIARGVKLLGWAFIVSGAVALGIHAPSGSTAWPHLEMAVTFGGLHLAAGVYLFFTEKAESHL
jgi:hypothetical protein